MNNYEKDLITNFLETIFWRKKEKIMERYELVVPTIPKDVHKFIENTDVFFKYLPIYRICIIGNSEVEKYVLHDSKFRFINENELIDFELIRSSIQNKTSEEIAKKRSGWYAQQFIKMEFSKITKDEYYLLWDSDTIPTKKVNMFDSKPYFDCKKEYHKAYFNTIRNLFTGFEKINDASFISEHMLIKTSIMRSMINEIESQHKEGKRSFQKIIIDSIDAKDIIAGFSEFETYGTYCMYRFPDEYSIRNWTSLRCGGFFFTPVDLTEEKLTWLSSNYDAVSIEKSEKLARISRIINNKKFEKIFKANILEYIGMILKIKRKIINRKPVD